MLERAKKEELVANLKQHIEKAQAVFLTNLVGVTSNDAVKIRKSVRSANGNIVITRNTLFKRAAKGTYLEELVKGIKGPTALAFAFDEAPAVAKVLYDASKELELVQLRAAILDGKLLTVKEVEALAQLPSREQMLATLLATFNAPVSAFVRVVDAIRKQKETAA